jgi:thymidine kinase
LLSIKIDRLGNALQDLKISEIFHIKNEFDSVVVDEDTATTVKQQFIENKTNESSTTVIDETKLFEEDLIQKLNLNINEENFPIYSISFKVKNIKKVKFLKVILSLFSLKFK